MPEAYEKLKTFNMDARKEASDKRQIANRLSNLCHGGYVERIKRGSYLLTPKGRERFLWELREHDPSSPLLKRKLVIVDVQVEPLEGGGYLASCDAIQGCHAEGETIADSLANLEDVARILLELRREDGLELPENLEHLRPDTIVKAQVIVPLPV